MDFDAAISLERVGAAAHRLSIPDGWQQGRGAFGGLVLGASLAAMVADEPDASRAPRTFTGDICAPALALPVVSQIETRVLRRGKNQTNVTATLTQDGNAIAQSSAVLATPRSAKVAQAWRAAGPDPTPFEQTPIVPTDAGGPVFTRHYEYRVEGGALFARSGEPAVAGWVRERTAPTRVTHAVLLARLDAFWPTLFAVEGGPRPVATVSFMAEFLSDPATLDPRTPLYYRARGVAESGGYFVELRELWSGGQLVALNQQTFAILG